VTAIFLALRLGLWGIIGWSALAVVFIVLRVEAFYGIAGHSATSRTAFGASIQALAPQFMVLLPPPIHPDTVAGYVEYGGFLPLAILFAVWAMTSATGAARGDEARGTVEAILATGVSRYELVMARMIAFAIAITIAATLSALGYVVVVTMGGDALDMPSLVAVTLQLITFSLSCYALSFLVVQFSAARATAVAGIVLLALFLINSLSRTYSSLWSVRWLSPFRYLDISRPLPPGGNFDVNALIALLGITLVAGFAAAAAFGRRDLGSSLVSLPVLRQRASYDAARGPWWRIPVIRGLYDRRVGLLFWSVGLAGLGVILVSLAKTVVDPLLSVRAFSPYFESFVRGNVYPSFLGFVWFNLAQLLFAAFAITQVARWSAEDADGRLELILSQPQSRVGVVIERMAVLAMAALVIAAVSGEAVFYASHRQGIELNGQRLLGASLMLVPFALVFASIGSLLGAWNPRAAVGLLGAVAFASYMDAEIGPLMKLPVWVQDLSAFKLFGRPLLDGVDGRSLAIMMLVIVIGVGSSILALQRRDIGS
jgi:ABC-2 type transport system permease protein